MPPAPGEPLSDEVARSKGRIGCGPCALCVFANSLPANTFRVEKQMCMTDRHANEKVTDSRLFTTKGSDDDKENSCRAESR